MSEKDNSSLNKEQEKPFPQIEDEINERLDNELKESALKFIAHLSANQMTPLRWFGQGYWKIPGAPIGKKSLFGIHLYGFNPRAHNNGWVLWFFPGGYSGEADEEVIKLVRDNVGYCVKCSSECSKGVDMTIFGREYTNMCCQFPVRIENPDDETLEKIKKLVDFRQEVLSRSN